MMDKRFLESFLRLNNIGNSASKEEVTRALVQAHWPPEQIEEALLLRTSTHTPTASQQLAQKREKQVFRPDMDWSSSKLSLLLGTDVVVDPASLRIGFSDAAQSRMLGKKFAVGFGVTLAAMAIAASLGIGLMYFFGIGPFHTQTAPII